MAFSPQEQQLIKYGVENGKSRDEIEKAVVRLRTGAGPVEQPAPEEKPKGPGLQERLATVGDESAKEISENIQGTGDKSDQSAIRRGFQATAAAFSTPLRGAKELLPEAARKGIDTATEAIGSGFKFLTDKISDIPALQSWIEKHPDAAKALEEVAGTAAAGGDIASSILAAEGAAKGTQKVVDTTKKVASTATSKTTSAIDDVYKAGLDLKEKARVSLAGKNVEPQLRESAKRLFLQGTDRIDDPIGTYNKYLSQSEKAIKDIKADPAIATVGEDIGKAYEKVGGQRRAVGKVMSEEIKKIGTIKTNVLEDVDAFVKDLADEGLIYDRAKQAITQTTRQSKMGATDLDLLESYAKEFQKLGSKPTIAELDSFMSRIPKELEVYKSGKNITGTTNAERIIKKSLSALRNQFDPEATGNKALAPYAEARSAYADLSDFLEEGGSFLGKKTQAGDFAKDASLAKSAVQSILNNGKKDWIARLESLTGENLLDKAVLALQAMKDAGDFRGLSLLQTLSEGAIPTSKAGFTQKIVDYALSQASEKVIGTPAEQTRVFLKSLKDAVKKASGK